MEGIPYFGDALLRFLQSGQFVYPWLLAGCLRIFSVSIDQNPPLVTIKVSEVGCHSRCRFVIVATQVQQRDRHNFAPTSHKLSNINFARMASMITESINTVSRHYKEKNLNWPMIIYIGLAHVAAVIGLFSIQYCHKYTLLWAFILWPISGLGITGGVHRLWAHRSYKATFGLRVFLMLVNSIANQGSIWHWSRDHRVHHKYSEVRNNCSSLLS
jgi:hypothetical protein